MVKDLKVDTAALRQTAIDIIRIQSEFQSTDTYVANLRPNLGHDGLAGRVEQFMDSYSVHRERLVRALDGLDQAARDIAQAFEDADSKLAQALRGDGGTF